MCSYISQGSVSTCLRCGETTLLRISYECSSERILKIGQLKVVWFLTHGIWIQLDAAAQLTFVAALDQCLIDVMLSDVLQDVEETHVDSVRLFHNDVQ